MLAAKFSGNIFVNLLGVWAVSIALEILKSNIDNLQNFVNHII
jgi:hypothetical protein